jgi:hypothetical protein
VSRQKIPIEALINLRQRLDMLPSRCQERRLLIEQTALLYGVSCHTVYRALRGREQPNISDQRRDYGIPRNLSRQDMELYCEVIAAMKIRTNNKKGRHLSTQRAIELLEEHGMDTPLGFIQPAKGLLTKATVNRYLKAWGYSFDYITRQPAAVRFQAEYSNACWHFDLSPSDLKHLKVPKWLEPDRGNPKLMLYSVVDDRSGVCYQEYHCVYGEDVTAALRFLFNAMSEKSLDGFEFHGIPEMIYTDNGPIAKSRVFQNVMNCLGIKLVTHMPQGKDGRRRTARSKGKVERPFRTVKEAHETLYHFHEPASEVEANLWLHKFLINYNNQKHRIEPHSRIEDWRKNIPDNTLKKMCDWSRFCTFAREPEERKVDGTARVTVSGVAYEVEPDLAGETVTLWWGLFDDQLYIEWQDLRYGPYYPVNAPIPLHSYRSRKKTKKEERIERIETLAKRLSLPRTALSGVAELQYLAPQPPVTLYNVIPFRDPDPYQEFTYPSVLLAKHAISEYLGLPLAKLTTEQKAFIDALLLETLNKKAVIEQVRSFFKSNK